jgi:hypothetical protein
VALTLTEELALLAFDVASGRPYQRSGSALPPAMAATLVLDLQTVGAVTLDDELRVHTTGRAPTDPLLAAPFAAIDGEAEARSLRTWVLRPTHLRKGLPLVVYDRLVERGVLADEDHRRLFRLQRYAEIGGREHADLVATLGAVLDGADPGTGDELVLLAVLPPARLTSAVFPARDRRATEQRIGDLLAGDDVASDTARLVVRAVAGEVAAAVVAGVAAGAV